MKHFPVAVDLLAQAIERVRPDLDRSIPLKKRTRCFWAAVVCSRTLGTADVLHAEFKRLADETGLLHDLHNSAPYAGAETVNHLIRWGLLEHDPFGDAT